MAKLTILTNFLVNLVNFAKFVMQFFHHFLDHFVFYYRVPDVNHAAGFFAPKLYIFLIYCLLIP